MISALANDLVQNDIKSNIIMRHYEYIQLQQCNASQEKLEEKLFTVSIPYNLN